MRVRCRAAHARHCDTAPNAMPIRSRPLRTALVAVATLAALLLAAWGALVIAFPPARVRALVAAQLQRSFRRGVRFTGVGVSLWPPVRLHASDVALAEPGGFAAGSAARAARIDLDLD